MTQQPGRKAAGLTWGQLFAIIGLAVLVSLVLAGVLVWILAGMPW